MARFEWQRFLKQHRIPFVTTGPNVGRGNINIRCPFCGQDDPSEHMGLGKRGWGCLRNSSHRGKDPARLIQRLLKCSHEEAVALSKGDGEAPAPSRNELAESLAALKRARGASLEAIERPLALPPEARPLKDQGRFSTSFWEYLEERGFRSAQIDWLARNYDLHYALSGDLAYRLIIPIYDRYGQLLSWTARGISPTMEPRYKTLRVNGPPELPKAKLAINHTVLGLPLLYGCTNPKVLIVTEGPLDALKLTAYGHALGMWATCLFGLNVYPEQLEELRGLAGRFQRFYLMLDPDAAFQVLRIFKQLTALTISPLKLPPGAEDPGALCAEDVTSLALKLTTGRANL